MTDEVVKQKTPRTVSEGQLAYESGLKTARHKGPDGCGQWIRWDVNDRLVDEERDERYIDCPCGKRFVLAIGGVSR